MDGLECSEMMLSSLSGRLDAEYYSKTAESIEQFIMRKEHIFLKKKDVVSGPFGSTLKSSAYMTDGDIAFVRIENIRGGFHISRDSLVYISNGDNTRLANSQLYTDDLILSKVGSVGLFARVDSELGTCNISENNIGLKLSAYSTQEKHVMLAYLNSHYGQILLQRRKSGNVQPKLNVSDMCIIPIPRFNDDFSERVSSLIVESDNAIRESSRIYTETQNILNDAIHFTSSSLSQKNVTSKSFSEVFSTGRLDAEYFMPKYDYILDKLKGAYIFEDVCNIHGDNFTPQNGKRYSYIELADIGTYGNITGTITADGAELPTRARRIIHAGQVIVSSIEGSLQSCALITEEYDNALCSTGFYVIDSDVYNSETLLMLFKSSVIQDLMKRGCSGTILSSISENELQKINLPIIDRETQNIIAGHVQQSFTLRRKSEHLINAAVHSVELAIESSEQSAITYLEELHESFKE